MISIKQINYALTVAKTLHFRKAAEICFISPSTLSNAITEMENQLGIKIFERDNIFNSYNISLVIFIPTCII